MSRVAPGRYVLITPQDRDAMLSRLEGSGQTALANRLSRAVYHDVRGEQEARGDVAAILSCHHDYALTEEELAGLLVTALLVTSGHLSGPEATRRIRDVVDASLARKEAAH